MSHSEEPHEHTLQWENNDGEVYRYTHECPLRSDSEDVERMRAAIEESGSVNNLMADGVPQDFPTVALLMFNLGLEPSIIGHKYQTAENLMQLMAIVGGK